MYGIANPPYELRACKCSLKIFFAFLIPVPKTSLILLASCSMRERFLEAILQRTERELAEPGRPGTVDGLVAGGALGGAAPSLGRARCLAVRGGFTTCLKGARLVPWRLPPLHPLARFARDRQTSDALRRENAEVWLFEILKRICARRRNILRVIRGLDPRIHHASQDSCEGDGWPGQAHGCPV